MIASSDLREGAAAAAGGKAIADAPRLCLRLPPELLANIHDRLGFVDRVAFAAVFAASCGDGGVFKPSAPWLLLPGKTTETVELFSVADQSVATVPAPDPALRDHFVLGSSRGWLATADNLGQIYLVNPATGEQHALPHITTTGIFLRRHSSFCVSIKSFLTIRFGGGPPCYGDNHWGNYGGTYTFSADQLRMWFYRKVVLSPASPSCPGSYVTAMLILERDFGTPAFTTADDPAWKLAPSRDGVEDAIHHNGQFYSVSYTGVVEAWRRDADSGAYTSTAVTPRLTTEEEGKISRKYLAAALGGRLMVVLKYVQVIKEPGSERRWTCFFKVHVLGDDGQWKETTDIGDAALFVGVNSSLCVPTRGRPEMEAGSVYFTDDELGWAALHNRDDLPLPPYDSDDSDVRAVGVYSLKNGTVKKIDALGQQYRRFSTPPAWITPSIP